MGLWQDYQANNIDATLVEGVPNAMQPLLVDWLGEIANRDFFEPYEMACDIQNRFRVNDIEIRRTRPNNYLEAPNDYRFVAFLMDIAVTDSELFFVILDYLVQKIPSGFSTKLANMLDNAGHKYQVRVINGVATITERVTPAEEAMLDSVLNSKQVYASEFQDAFKAQYGQEPNYTSSAGESFQALESLLKVCLGDDKGDNLGALLGWLRDNRESWRYRVPSDGQEGAEDHILALVDFVNKSYRKVKHGQAEKKLEVEKSHAATLLRVVALLIYEFENTIEVLS